MKRIFAISVCLTLIPSFLMAQTLEEKRRVEEEKREDLRSSEAQIFKGKTQPMQISPIDMVYFTELMPKKVTFGYDVCKVAVILMGVEDQYIDLDAQVTFLKEHNLLPKKIMSEFNPLQPLRKGLFSYIFYKALKIKGGVCLHLFGVSQRYALKELVFETIAFPGDVNDIVSGEELISVYIQAVNYIAKKQPINAAKQKNED